MCLTAVGLSVMLAVCLFVGILGMTQTCKVLHSHDSDYVISFNYCFEEFSGIQLFLLGTVDFLSKMVNGL